MIIDSLKKLITQTNTLSLAIGIITGAATTNIVTSTVNDLLMPFITEVLPKGNWRVAELVLSSTKDLNGHVQTVSVKYGHLLGAIIDFVTISLLIGIFTAVLFHQKKAVDKELRKCPFCLEPVADTASKCKSCCSEIADTKAKNKCMASQIN